MSDFYELIGKTITQIEQCTSERIVFHINDGTAYESVHLRCCCESVGVHHIEGNIDEVIGLLVVEAEETQDNDNKPDELADSWTWTHQRIKTVRGEVTFHWLGESNGYYGETPYFQLTHGKKV